MTEQTKRKPGRPRKYATSAEGHRKRQAQYRRQAADRRAGIETRARALVLVIEELATSERVGDEDRRALVGTVAPLMTALGFPADRVAALLDATTRDA